MPNLWLDEKADEPAPLRYARRTIDILGVLLAGALMFLAILMVLFMAFD